MPVYPGAPSPRTPHPGATAAVFPHPLRPGRLRPHTPIRRACWWQLFYQFVSRDLIPNRQSEYKRLGDIINDARLAGPVDREAIVDRTRSIRALPHWSDAAGTVACGTSSRRTSSAASRTSSRPSARGAAPLWVSFGRTSAAQSLFTWWKAKVDDSNHRRTRAAEPAPKESHVLGTRRR